MKSRVSEICMKQIRVNQGVGASQIFLDIQTHQGDRFYYHFFVHLDPTLRSFWFLEDIVLLTRFSLLVRPCTSEKQRN